MRGFIMGYDFEVVVLRVDPADMCTLGHLVGTGRRPTGCAHGFGNS